MCYVFFLFKQKTAYDRRISDWSSDVCSSDLHGASDETRRRIDRQGAALARLGRVESLSFGDSVSGGAAQIVVDEATFILPLEGVIDIEAEKARLAKALRSEEHTSELQSLMRISYAVFCLKKKTAKTTKLISRHITKTMYHNT